jgi:hypothetical protein
MKIKFQETPKQVELVKAMASKDKLKAAQAQETFAALMQPVLEKVILENDITSALFERMPFREDEDPSFPLDPFRSYKEDYLSIWAQEVAGGLATNHVKSPTDEVKFVVWPLDSAISWDKKFARTARLPIVAGYLTMMAQEILRKLKYNGWSTIMTATANASHKVNKTETKHVFRATTKGAFNMDEMNYWFTLMRRLNQSLFAGSPAETRFGLTDAWCSPEFVQKIRSLSYNPINTKGANNVTGTQYSPAVTLPDAARAAMLNTAGAQNFLGVNLVELNEMGIGYDFNNLFDAAAASTSYTNAAGAGGAAFDAATEEVVIGVNGMSTIGIRPVETSDSIDNPESFSLMSDDQFLTRSDKVGQYGRLVCGHLILSTLPLSAFII